MTIARAGSTVFLHQPEKFHIDFLCQCFENETFIRNVFGDRKATYDDRKNLAIQMIMKNKVSNSTQLLLIASAVKDLNPVGLIFFPKINWLFRFADLSLAMMADRAESKSQAVEMIYLTLNYAFEELRLNAIYGFTYEDNLAANRLFKSAAEKVGILRDHAIIDGEFRSISIYQITKDSLDQAALSGNRVAIRYKNNTRISIIDPKLAARVDDRWLENLEQDS